MSQTYNGIQLRKTPKVKLWPTHTHTHCTHIHTAYALQTFTYTHYTHTYTHCTHIHTLHTYTYYTYYTHTYTHCTHGTYKHIYTFIFILYMYFTHIHILHTHCIYTHAYIYTLQTHTDTDTYTLHTQHTVHTLYTHCAQIHTHTHKHTNRRTVTHITQTQIGCSIPETFRTNHHSLDSLKESRLITPHSWKSETPAKMFTVVA